MSSSRYSYEKDKKIKEKLTKLMLSIEKSYGVDEEEGLTLLEKTIEWLQEDFGVQVEGDWQEVINVILSNKEIKSRDLAVFLITEGVEVDESIWFDES